MFVVNIVGSIANMEINTKHIGDVTKDAHYIPIHICITLEVYVEDPIFCC